MKTGNADLDKLITWSPDEGGEFYTCYQLPWQYLDGVPIGSVLEGEQTGGCWIYPWTIRIALGQILQQLMPHRLALRMVILSSTCRRVPYNLSHGPLNTPMLVWTAGWSRRETVFGILVTAWELSHVCSSLLQSGEDFLVDLQTFVSSFLIKFG
jgi:hypothetical protein